MQLQHFFAEHPRAAVAFSGGVDSAYLLYAALQSGAEVCAYYVKSAFQPGFELQDAKRLTQQLGAPLRILPVDILMNQTVCSNPANRCYFCKKEIFTAIADAAKQDGFSLLLDGTNASDDALDRPGMRALQELSVRSPLRECGLTKQHIRELSRQAGLFTWNKPAYACLATRIPTGTEITAQKLAVTQTAEDFLSRLGFSDFRVRLLGEDAKLQVRAEQLPLLLTHREEIVAKLKSLYAHVLLDLEVRV